MADREKIIKAIEICYTKGHNCTECPFFYKDECNDELMRDALALLKEQEWISVTDRMPEEHETIFAKFKGTEKWSPAMFAQSSDDVRVVVVFADGTRRVYHSHTIDGKWDIEKQPIKRTVTHWMPNPKLPEVTDE